jgi:hypothetical protein
MTVWVQEGIRAGEINIEVTPAKLAIWKCLDDHSITGPSEENRTGNKNEPDSRTWSYILERLSQKNRKFIACPTKGDPVSKKKKKSRGSSK